MSLFEVDTQLSSEDKLRTSSGAGVVLHLCRSGAALVQEWCKLNNRRVLFMCAIET